MRRLNNKGYMLVEIILAFSIAMAITYYLTDLTIKLKNKNDDLLVKTLVATDQAIIYNTIMRDLYRVYDDGSSGADKFQCNNISVNNTNKTFGYTFADGTKFKNIVSKYVTDFKYVYNNTEYCHITEDTIKIHIDLKVKQLPNENFDIDISFDK